MTTLKSQYEQQIAELELKNDDESKLQVRRLKTKITSLLATSGEENRSLLATFELKENISKEELEKGKKISFVLDTLDNEKIVPFVIATGPIVSTPEEEEEDLLESLSSSSKIYLRNRVTDDLQTRKGFAESCQTRYESKI